METCNFKMIQRSGSERRLSLDPSMLPSPSSPNKAIQRIMRQESRLARVSNKAKFRRRDFFNTLREVELSEEEMRERLKQACTFGQRLLDEIEKLGDEVGDKDGMVKALQMENFRLQTDYANLEEKVTKLRHDKNDAVVENQILVRKADTLREQNKELEVELRRVMEKNKVQREKILDLNKKVFAIKTRKRSLKKKHSFLQERISCLERKVSSPMSDFHEMKVSKRRFSILDEEPHNRRSSRSLAEPPESPKRHSVVGGIVGEIVSGNREEFQTLTSLGKNKSNYNGLTGRVKRMSMVIQDNIERSKRARRHSARQRLKRSPSSKESQDSMFSVSHDDLSKYVMGSGPSAAYGGGGEINVKNVYAMRRKCKKLRLQMELMKEFVLENLARISQKIVCVNETILQFPKDDELVDLYAKITQNVVFGLGLTRSYYLINMNPKREGGLFLIETAFCGREKRISRYAVICSKFFLISLFRKEKKKRLLNQISLKGARIMDYRNSKRFRLITKTDNLLLECFQESQKNEWITFLHELLSVF